MPRTAAAPLARFAISLLLAAPLTLVACGHPASEKECEEIFARSAAIELKDVKRGLGIRAEEGNLVEVHYTGRISNGAIVIDTRSNGKPHRFVIGDGTVIPGMDSAVRGMRPGGVREATLPPHTHYGRKGYADVIPEESMMYFEIEMLRVSRSATSTIAWSDADEPSSK